MDQPNGKIKQSNCIKVYRINFLCHQNQIKIQTMTKPTHTHNGYVTSMQIQNNQYLLQKHHRQHVHYFKNTIPVYSPTPPSSDCHKNKQRNQAFCVRHTIYSIKHSTLTDKTDDGIGLQYITIKMRALGIKYVAKQSKPKGVLKNTLPHDTYTVINTSNQEHGSTLLRYSTIILQNTQLSY